MLLLPLAALSLRLSPLASRPPLHSPAAPRGRPTTMSDADVPAIVIGGGRIGQTLATLGESVLLRRGEPFPASPSSGPIYVCTRNDALAAVVAATPPERRGDLVFLQNGMLGKFLAANGLEDATQVLLYLAVAKLGEKPIDGITEVNPEGLTASTGKWAHAFKARLAKGGLTCHVREGGAYTKAMLEKHVWICAFMLVGALHDGITVGEVEAKHSAELRAVIEELIAAGETELDVRLDDGAYERLAAYGRSVSHFPTAVKELEWRNGWFYDISLKATDAGKPDPMPMHTAGLTKLGVIPSSS